jgi:hypothetical protein
LHALITQSKPGQFNKETVKNTSSNASRPRVEIPFVLTFLASVGAMNGFSQGFNAVLPEKSYDQVPGQGTRRECRAATCTRCRLFVHLSNGGEQIALIGWRRLGSEGRNLYVVARLRIIHGSRYCRSMRLYLWPSTRRKNNDGDGSLLQVLLVGKIAVSSHQNLETISLCREQQFAVFER